MFCRLRLEIAVQPAFRDTPLVERLAARLKQEKGITLVEYPRDWIDRLSLLVLAVAWLKWIFAGVMFVITFFIVSSAVKLAILARRDEIEIMQLVGSSRTMIQASVSPRRNGAGISRWGAGSGRGSGALSRRRAENFPYSSALWGASELNGNFSTVDGIAIIVLLGWLLGCAGSFFSLRSFIRTWRSS